MCYKPNEGLHINNYQTSNINKYMLIAEKLMLVELYQISFLSAEFSAIVL